jgi:hypothetical protein
MFKFEFTVVNLSGSNGLIICPLLERNATPLQKLTRQLGYSMGDKS